MAELLYIYNDYMKPATDGLLDLGHSSYQFNNLYITGKAYMDGIGETCLLDQGVQWQFRDTDIYLTSGDDGHLDFHADSSFDFNTTANDIILNFHGGTFTGIITWQHDLDRFDFSDDVWLLSTEELHFRDSQVYIYSANDGYLDLVADTQVRVTGNLHTTGYCPSTTTQTGATYTVLSTDDVVLCNYDGAMVVTLPVATGSGRVYFIKNIHATGTVTVEGDGSDTIDGEANFEMTEQYEGFSLLDGAANVWYIIGDTMTGDLILQDSVKLLLGTGSDFSIYHDGTSMIFDVEDTTDEIVFNEDGADTNFRVESDGNAYMLFLDAGNNRIGIGVSTPSVALEIDGHIQLTQSDWICGSNALGGGDGSAAGWLGFSPNWYGTIDGGASTIATHITCYNLGSGINLTSTPDGSTYNRIAHFNGIDLESWFGGNVKIGKGAAGVDYTLTFYGETYSGILAWMEDEDYFKFVDDIMLVGGENIVLDTSTGTKIGTATSQLLGFYNATPVNQPDTVADATTQDLTGTDTVDQTKLESDLTSCKNAINLIIDRLQELGLIA